MTEFLQGWEGQVGFGVETTFGTPVAPTIFQDVGQGSAELKTNKPNKELQVGIRGTKKPIKVSRSVGKTDTGGSISGAIYPDDFFNGGIFAAVQGNNNAVTPIGGDGALNGYSHVFTEWVSITDRPVGITVQAKIGGDANVKTKDFSGNICNGITIEVPDAGLVTLSSDWIGHSESAPGTATAAAASYSTDHPFEAVCSQLLIGNDSGSLVDVPFESLSFTHTVNAELVNENFQCSKFPTGRRFGTPDIAMEITLKSIDDNTQYAHFFNDDTQFVRLILKNDALSGTGPGSEYEIVIDLPVCEYFGETEGLTGPEQLTQPIQLQARYSVSDDFTVEYTVKNSVAAVYAV